MKFFWKKHAKVCFIFWLIATKVKCYFFDYEGNDSPNLFKLVTETQQNETFIIENNFSSIVNQPNGFICNRKAFCLSDIFTSLLRQFRISFLAQLSTLLFMPIVFFLFFTVVTNVMAFKGTERSKCSFNVNTSSDCTVQDPLQLNDPEERNAYFVSLVCLFTGLLLITTTTILYTKHLKIFQQEHRNCK